MSASDVHISKALSYWLRHKPDAAGLTLSSDGWADVDAVLVALAQDDMTVDWERLLHVVETNDKARFELSGDGSKIRARQGHSIEIDGDWVVSKPPEILYHGTVERFVDAIFQQGLLRMKRHHVHLSADIATATRVGARRGSPVVLCVRAQELSSSGVQFMLAGNGVWLVDHVPPLYLDRV